VSGASYKHSAPLEPGGMVSGASYKHSAPLEPGRRLWAARPTNIRLPWSRGGDCGRRVLQTFDSAGAGRGEGGACYRFGNAVSGDPNKRRKSRAHN